MLLGKRSVKNKTNLFEEVYFSKELSFSLSKMTLRSQKRNTVEELVGGNNQNVNSVAGTSKSSKVQTETLKEIKSLLRKEILSDLTKILAENQTEMLKLIAPVAKNRLH